MPKDNSNKIKVGDIMTTDITAAHPEDRITDVAKFLIQKQFDGLPVVDKHERLLGVVSMKELLSKQGDFLPTVASMMAKLELKASSGDSGLSSKLRDLKRLTVQSVMSKKPRYLISDATLEEAAEAFLLWRQDPLPVVDDQQKLVGLVTKYDLLKHLTTVIAPYINDSSFTEELDSPNVIDDLSKRYLLVNRTRVRFWYVAILIFFVIGIVVAMGFILRIRIY